MKRIALLAVALSLGAGTAFAATTGNSSANPAPAPQAQVQHHHRHMATARRINAREDRETKALNLLEAKGYASFTNFKPDGRDYAATVAKNGHNMTVRVDPHSGQITTQG